MIKEIGEIEKLARLKEDENQRLRMLLKSSDHFKVDKIVHQLYQKYLAEYDCTACANCCKNLNPNLSQEECINIANYLDLSLDEFNKLYIEREIAGGSILKGTGCPFLKDKKCSIYEHRPAACRSYPHLSKDNINHRLLNIIDNSFICPIVYNILEDLKANYFNNSFNTGKAL